MSTILMFENHGNSTIHTPFSVHSLHLYYFWLHKHMRSQFTNQKSNAYLAVVECGVLTPGPQGKSPQLDFKFFKFMN